MDGKQFGEEMVLVVRSYVERELNPVIARIEAIEKSIAALPRPEPVNTDSIVASTIERLEPEVKALRATVQDLAGSVLDAAATKAMVTETVAAEIGKIPVPRNGNDPDPEVVAGIARDLLMPDLDAIKAAVEAVPRAPTPEEVKALVVSEIAALPVPRNGEDADPVVVADMVRDLLLPDIKEIRESINAIEPAPTPEQIKALVVAEIEKIPAPEPGEPGKSITAEDVAPLIESEVQKRVAEIKIKDGRDGLDMADAMIDRDGHLVVTMSNGTTKNLGPVCGTNGESVTMEDVAPVIQKAVAEEVAKIPVPKNGEDGRSVSLDEIMIGVTAEIQKAVAALPPAEPGKSVTPDEVMPAIVAEIEARIAELPAPKDGDPGTSVTLDDVMPAIEAHIEKAVAALPPAEPGKSVTPDDVLPAIVAEIETRFAALPVPQDGKSVTTEEVAALAYEAVRTEVVPMMEAKILEGFAAIEILPPEKGEPGKSVTLDDVRPVIEEAVATAVAAIPVPQDGKSVEPAEVEAMVETAVARAVAEIPPAEPGKDGESVTLDDVAPVIMSEVKRLVDEFPRPKDGKSVTPEELAPMVVSEVEKAVAKIPVPKDGIGLADSFIDSEGNLVVTNTVGVAKVLGKVVGEDGEDGEDGDPGKSAEPPDLSEFEAIIDLPDDLNARIAEVVKMLAETPDLVINSASAPVPQAPAPVAPPVVNIQIPDVHVALPKQKLLRTIVEEHDANGRIKKMRQEEIE